LRLAAHRSSPPNSASSASNVGRCENDSNCSMCIVTTPM
jgi:hypothetical protein